MCAGSDAAVVRQTQARLHFQNKPTVHYSAYFTVATYFMFLLFALFGNLTAACSCTDRSFCLQGLMQQWSGGLKPGCTLRTNPQCTTAPISLWPHTSPSSCLHSLGNCWRSWLSLAGAERCCSSFLGSSPTGCSASKGLHDSKWSRRDLK